MPSKRNADRDKYYKTLIEETLVELGVDIHTFRNLPEAIAKTTWAQTIPPETLYLLDAIYQDHLDKIFDSLANADDLHVEKIALDAIDKSLQVRRGFIKKSEVLE